MPIAAMPVPRLNSSPTPTLKFDPIIKISITTPITIAAMLVYLSDTMALVLDIRHKFLTKADAESNGCAQFRLENVTVIRPN